MTNDDIGLMHVGQFEIFHQNNQIRRVRVPPSWLNFGKHCSRELIDDALRIGRLRDRQGSLDKR